MKINYITFNNGDNTYSIYHYDNGKSTRIDDKVYPDFMTADNEARRLAHLKSEVK